MPSQIVHGLSRYKKFGCRCDVCLAAYAQYRQKSRKTPKKIFIPASPLLNLLDTKYPTRAHEMRNTIKAWRKRGTIELYEADRICIMLGIHPYEIFGDIYFSGLEPEEVSA